MPMHLCIGIIEAQLIDQLSQCDFLLGRSRVLRCFAIGGNATDIANTDTVGIVTLAMRSHQVFSTSLVDAAIAVNHVVIPDVRKLSSQVPLTNVVHREVLAFRSG